MALILCYLGGLLFGCAIGWMRGYWVGRKESYEAYEHHIETLRSWIADADRRHNEELKRERNS